MAAPFRVKALYDYSSPHEDDLNFNSGQIITVTEQEDDDWYGGEYVDDVGVKQEGIFPRNFVEKVEPTAPPRPTRTRTKKDAESTRTSEDLAAPPPPPPAQEPAPEPAPEEAKPEPAPAPKPTVKSPPVEEPAPAQARPPVASPPPAEVSEPASAPAPAPPKPTEPIAAPKPAPPPAQPAAFTQAPKPKTGPPPVSEKPTASSFKDRIAAFNKSAAPPPAPFKPSGLGGSGSGFIKKPFVAPPPSRNAYVPPVKDVAPPPKIYRREEDPEVKEAEAENQDQAERAGLVPTDNNQEAADEDQPKPTSLKERIALLQKQQLEQAQRHGDSAAKKEKPKRPPKKRLESTENTELAAESEDSTAPAPHQYQADTEERSVRTSTDESQAHRAQLPPRRKSSKGPPAENVHDGNEADMSGAGDTTEGQDDTTEREDNDEAAGRVTRVPIATASSPPPVVPTVVPNTAAKDADDEDEDEEEEEEGEEEDDVDPEVRRKEELRARMAKMSGGMGFHGMFGAPMPSAPAAAPKKKKPSKVEAPPAEEGEESAPVSRAAPPVPSMMALPGLGGPRKSEDTSRPSEGDAEPTPRAVPPPVPSRAAEPEPRPEESEDDEEYDATTPAPRCVPDVPPRDQPTSPPVPGGRPAPPPVPTETRAPPAPQADLKSASDGSESGDELSAKDRRNESINLQAPQSPPLLPNPVQAISTRQDSVPTPSRPEELSPTSPTSASSKRNSRLPPPIPGSAPVPPPSQSRPPPPPPPGPLSRQSTMDDHAALPRRPAPQPAEEDDEEVTEYEGDYDTDIASSAPHKDALKSHARDSSVEDSTLQSPVSETPPKGPPPIPGAPPPRAVPPPIPTQPPPPPESKRRSVDAPRAVPPPPIPTQAPPLPDSKRRSVDSPRAAPPPPPPTKEPETAVSEDAFAAYNYSAPSRPSFSYQTPKIEEEQPIYQSPPPQSPPDRRAPPPAPSGRGPVPRQSLDVQRGGRRSLDVGRPSMESGFIANDIDLAVQSGWWRQANQVPPVLQGRRDIFVESEESTTTNQGSKTVVTRETFILFQDYSQTILTVSYDPYDPSDVELEQRHEPPPRPLRQDQMEEYYERFGRPIADAVASKKDTVVGDGTPHGLVLELLKPFRDALPPVGTRSFGALVYANMANASTTLNDVIRPGDIISIRNAKFQGKHGAMHAKYSAEVGKPDHVGIVAEWDGTKKKVRAWEQGRESRKVKQESFKLDDLRSGEVKIWRVMPRSWVGWNAQP
ncbi:hypothetical protein S40285_05336 [Stachybotrys chlorohalonatus IBT 40285]|uniref:SH3 domain-containing protein n=1 Tax=Stachybotrys chlorohalonatus (strain IBT 40285) TaxID=1283841 RepID=A0A084QNV3_STAC4|nr:hypothetical protein S40285_05336 [Stachybotrys chlorohalonata IBT 40285]